EQREGLGLDAEALRLVERYYTDFVRAGANLSDADKARLKEMNAELAKLGTQDRKSTRLNSSHVKISYAVFCLKKKNTTKSPEATIKLTKQKIHTYSNITVDHIRKDDT